MSEHAIQADLDAAYVKWWQRAAIAIPWDLRLRETVDAAAAPLYAEIERQAQEIERLGALLNEAREAFLKHSQWCGFNPDAPGDPIIHVFDRILAEQVSNAFVEANRDGK